MVTRSCTSCGMGLQWEASWHVAWRRAALHRRPTGTCIANEAGISGQAIGAIEIADRYALVEVPDETADEIVRALSRASIRGRRVPVRREDR